MTVDTTGAISIGMTVDGRYEVRRERGRGAAGLVYEAVHTFTGRSVVLKVVAPDVPRSQIGELRTRLVREARALAAVRHPRVVEVLDGGVLADGTPYIVMENLEGRTLGGLLLTRERLSKSITVALVLELCDALKAVHAAGLVHRDVKPDNVLVVRDLGGAEHVKLIDFGMAQVRSEDKLTRIGALIGTPQYMAPEQLLAADTDLRVDVYALGVTMFECLAGHVPYAGPYAQVVLQACSDGPVAALPADVDPALAAIVSRAIAKKRELRYSSTAEMAAAVLRANPGPRQPMTLLGSPATPNASALASPGVQRRKWPRAPYMTPVVIKLSDRTVEARTEDISEGGLLVITHEPLVPDPRLSERNVRGAVRFALPIEGLVVSSDAHLRWVRSQAGAGTSGPCALGLEFVDLSPPVRASIARYVELMGDSSA